MLTKIVQGGRWNTADSLITILQDVGDKLQKAAPMGRNSHHANYCMCLLFSTVNTELAVGNIVKRLISLIREEEENLLREGDGALDFGEFKGAVLEAIKELLDEIMNLKNVAEQALEHIHSKLVEREIAFSE